MTYNKTNYKNEDTDSFYDVLTVTETVITKFN